MMRKVVVATSVAATAATSVASTECDAGYKLKKVLKGLTCDSANTDGTSCNTNCCELDDKKCGGLGVTCNAGTYKHSTSGSSKAKKAAADAWANTAATAATIQSACCTPQVKCSSRAYTCPAGYTYANNKAAGACPSDAASCVSSPVTCCKPDTTKCGAHQTVLTNGASNDGCVKGGYLVPTLDDGWKSTTVVGSAANAKDVQRSCCAVKATCSLYTCSAGETKKANSDQTECSGAAADKASCRTTCCDPNKDTCGGHTTITCTADRYRDLNLNGKYAGKAGVDKVANCCSAKATCASAKCPAGAKLKKTALTTPCTEDAASCSAATCCEADKLTCGGTTGIVCAKDFYLESSKFVSEKYTQAQQDAWNSKPTTDKTKNTDCCTAVAVCAAVGVVATTTPAASTTPVAAARLFSEHKAAVVASSSKNGLFVAVGAFAGMTVLFLVQKLRQGASYTQIEA